MTLQLVPAVCIRGEFNGGWVGGWGIKCGKGSNSKFKMCIINYYCSNLAMALT